MPETRNFIRVFLASPGDLTDERRTAKQVIDELNEQWGEHLGSHVELVGWEDTVACVGRPQATINRDLERCEVFVGILWKRWGTPPGGESKYTSGFEEEFRNTLDRRSKERGPKERGPEMALFLKEIPPDLRTDPGEDLKKVLSFRETLVRERQLFYKEFKDTRDFERQLRSFITKYVRDRKAREEVEAPDRAQAPATSSPAAATPVGNPPRHSLLSREGAEFLRGFLVETEETAEGASIPAAEIARFRLLGGAIHREGNDDPTLGVHDLNLLYRDRSRFSYGEAEIQVLVERGLQHFHNHNVPIWHWLVSTDGFSKSLLVRSSVLGSSTGVQVNALAAMTLVHQQIPATPELPREDFTGFWLGAKTEGSLKVAALGYLGECGATCDLPLVRHEFDKRDSQTTNAAADAFLRISLRDSHSKALDALMELQPGSISPGVLAAIVKDHPGIPIGQFLPGLEHRNADVRLATLRLLRARGLPMLEHARKLLDDGVSVVRYEALKTLIIGDAKFTIDEAKAILVRPVPNMWTNSVGGVGNGEELLAEFSRDCLCAMNDAELELRSKNCNFYERDAFHVLAERDFKRCAVDIRHSVDDRYKSYLDESIAKMRETFGGSDQIVEKTQSLSAFVASRLTRTGLGIICRNGDLKDLDRVRGVLRSGAVGCSQEEFDYLRSCGEWQDISLITEILRRPRGGSAGAFFGLVDEPSYRAAARAVYALGRARLSELLALPMPSELLVHVLSEIPTAAFRRLDDSSIMQLLHSEHEDTRKIAALKCVEALAKGRVSRLLADNLKGEGLYYYNVVHWLDLAVSAPRSQALIAAHSILRERRS